MKIDTVIRTRKQTKLRSKPVYHFLAGCTSCKPNHNGILTC
uniref:Uncharacterized protein n=1 Tax=Rhizophora mucronata TaxID=61149 RepID=A0A2P2QRG7_RHIMU